MYCKSVQNENNDMQRVIIFVCVTSLRLGNITYV